MPFPHGYQLLSQDRLCCTYLQKSPWQIIRKGKRVGADCQLTHAERCVYVNDGTVAAVKFIRNTRQIDLRDALELLDKARGKLQRYAVQR